MSASDRVTSAANVRDFQAPAGRQNALCQAGREASRTGDELRHHGADQCRSAGDTHA
jgi:hypothetical protein